MIVTSTITVAIYYGVCSTVIAGKPSAEVLPVKVLMFRIRAICNYGGMTAQSLDFLSVSGCATLSCIPVLSRSVHH